MLSQERDFGYFIRGTNRGLIELNWGRERKEEERGEKKRENKIR